MHYRLEVKNIGKKFNHGFIFKKVSFQADGGTRVSIAGDNGSGKTTLLKMIAGLLYPDKGDITLFCDDQPVSPLSAGTIGYLGPYMELYDKLTAGENLQFFASQLGVSIRYPEILGILDKTGLKGRDTDLLEGFSSGMKQRLKYAVLYLKKFPVLLLDEPTANFDAAGKQLFARFLEENRDSIIVIASNEKEEVQIGDTYIELS